MDSYVLKLIIQIASKRLGICGWIRIIWLVHMDRWMRIHQGWVSLLILRYDRRARRWDKSESRIWRNIRSQYRWKVWRLYLWWIRTKDRFRRCKGIVNRDISIFRMSNVTKMYAENVGTLLWVIISKIAQEWGFEWRLIALYSWSARVRHGGPQFDLVCAHASTP